MCELIRFNPLEQEELILEINIALKSAELEAMLDDSEHNKLQQTPKTHRLKAMPDLVPDHNSGVVVKVAGLVKPAEIEETPPEFEFHGRFCPHYENFRTLGKNPRNFQGADQLQPVKESLIVNPEVISNCLTNLGLHGCIGEPNLVLSIFELIHSMHIFLSDELLTRYPNYLPSDYVYDWSTPISMPHTKSIPSQLNFAARKLNKFIGRMRRLLDTNMHFDYTKFKQCDDSLKLLERMHMDMVKFAKLEMRHVQYKFVSEKIKETAADLELLLQRINDQIREAHIFNTVFNWEMDLEHRQSMAMTAQRQSTLDYGLAMALAEIHPKDTPEVQNEKTAILNVGIWYGMEQLSMRVIQCNDMLTNIMENPQSFVRNYALECFYRKIDKAETFAGEIAEPAVAEVLQQIHLGLLGGGEEVPKFRIHRPYLNVG